jgi:hypothetical protein
MSRRKLYGIVGGIGVITAVAALALALVFSQGGSGPAASSPGPAASAVTVAQPSGEAATSGGVLAEALPPGGPVSQSGLEAAASAAPERAGGPSEGIKVHGHWTIEVKNPDGTLASRTEFENALVPIGRVTLMMVLTRNKTVGLWLVQLAGPQPCVAGPCITVEGAYSGGLSAGWFKNLTVGFGPGGTIVLSGTVIAGQTSTITNVSAWLNSCADTEAPGALTAACTGQGFLATSQFASTNLASPISVSAGQQILVTVNISFS